MRPSLLPCCYWWRFWINSFWYSMQHHGPCPADGCYRLPIFILRHTEPLSRWSLLVPLTWVSGGCCSLALPILFPSCHGYRALYRHAVMAEVHQFFTVIIAHWTSSHVLFNLDSPLCKASTKANTFSIVSSPGAKLDVQYRA